MIKIDSIIGDIRIKQTKKQKAKSLLNWLSNCENLSKIFLSTKDHSEKNIGILWAKDKLLFNFFFKDPFTYMTFSDNVDYVYWDMKLKAQTEMQIKSHQYSLPNLYTLPRVDWASRHHDYTTSARLIGRDIEFPSPHNFDVGS